MSDLPKDAPGLQVGPIEPATDGPTKYQPRSRRLQALAAPFVPLGADWATIDALTEHDIHRQLATNPDAAPEIVEAFERWTVYHPALHNAQVEGDDMAGPDAA